MALIQVGELIIITQMICLTITWACNNLGLQTKFDCVGMRGWMSPRDMVRVGKTQEETIRFRFKWRFQKKIGLFPNTHLNLIGIFHEIDLNKPSIWWGNHHGFPHWNGGTSPGFQPTVRGSPCVCQSTGKHWPQGAAGAGAGGTRIYRMGPPSDSVQLPELSGWIHSGLW